MRLNRKCFPCFLAIGLFAAGGAAGAGAFGPWSSLSDSAPGLESQPEPSNAVCARRLEEVTWPKNMKVILWLELDRKGAVSGLEIVNAAEFPGDCRFDLAADIARKTVLRTAPFSFLDEDSLKDGEKLELVFYPGGNPATGK